MTNPLYFSKITLRESAPISKLRELSYDGYAPHKTIWQLLSRSPTQERDFLFRYDIEPRSGLPRFYVVSCQEAKDTSGLWDIQTKPYLVQEPEKPSLFTLGDQFRFSLRVNPTFDKSDRSKKQKQRHDLICHLRKQLPKNAHGEREEPHAATEHRACKEWLERKTTLGFRLVNPDESLLVEQYDQLRFKHKDQTTILSRVDMSGVLEVTDVKKFWDNLTKGIGHGKAFGCGLLLIRRV
ncbi:MAG: type I-E CRISPR-associated protein Cas6/Cse3/CasE [Candidatus Kapabacteria bacterium]|jgi:CRISPR system Cascade subunit CasE|nr:type I-E CRISPR-associated protein Cas6/Cse3/CasE [Candidatus Kapabacteria bacterium]